VTGAVEVQASSRKGAVLVIACVVALMTVLDVSVVTVAVPAVRRRPRAFGWRAAVGGEGLQRQCSPTTRLHVEAALNASLGEPAQPAGAER
jgi:hypothetical protein